MGMPLSVFYLVCKKQTRNILKLLTLYLQNFIYRSTFANLLKQMSEAFKMKINGCLVHLYNYFTIHNNVCLYFVNNNLCLHDFNGIKGR